MKHLSAVGLVGLVAVAACTPHRRAPSPVTPIAPSTQVRCAAREYAAAGRCFTEARAACESLGCGTHCDIRGPVDGRTIACTRGTSSNLTRCEGFSNWQCPHDMACAEDPAPGSCKFKSSFDCSGICVPRCGGFDGLTCPAGLTCTDDQHRGACSHERDDDCAGICLPATRP